MSTQLISKQSNSRKKNQGNQGKDKSDVEYYYYGTIEIVTGRIKRSRWIPIHLKQRFIDIKKIRNLEILIPETDITSVDWADVKIVDMGNNNEVCSRCDGKVLAKGAFDSCLFFVGACRKSLVRKHKKDIENSILGNSIETLLFEAEQIVSSQEPDFDKAFTLTVKAREISTWIGGDCFGATKEAVKELREKIQTAEYNYSAEQNCPEQVLVAVA